MKKYRIYHTEKQYQEKRYKELRAYKIVEVFETVTNVGVELEITPQTDLDALNYIMPFTTRLNTVLRINGINTVGDITKHPASHYMKFRNFGKKTMEELELLLERSGLKFAPEEQPIQAQIITSHLMEQL